MQSHPSLEPSRRQSWNAGWLGDFVLDIEMLDILVSKYLGDGAVAQRENIMPRVGVISELDIFVELLELCWWNDQ